MLPYVIVPPIDIGLMKLQPFGILVVLGVIVGISLATRRAKLVGLDIHQLQSFITWILVGGFIGGHVLDSIFYHPYEVYKDPWSLLKIWAGLSSFGGFIGATLGALAWKYYTTREILLNGKHAYLQVPVRRRSPILLLPYTDVIMAVFPFAWVFGRAGCSVVHDHPGARTSPSSWFSVAYGPGASTDFYFVQLRHGLEPRYDLGLLEMLFAVVLATAFAVTWRNRNVSGWYIVAASMAYAPVRFTLDFLRVSDPEGGDLRYALLTPAQWACIGLFVFGCGLAIRLVHRLRSQAPKILSRSTVNTSC
jgi:phosphatidylglycerol:prolipoprotein diacylglycerol transferase